MVPEDGRNLVIVERRVVGIDRHPGRVLVLARQAAAGALLLTLLPSVDPVQVHDEATAAAAAQHSPVAREVDQSFHGLILRERSAEPARPCTCRADDLSSLVLAFKNEAQERWLNRPNVAHADSSIT